MYILVFHKEHKNSDNMELNENLDSAPVVDLFNGPAMIQFAMRPWYGNKKYKNSNNMKLNEHRDSARELERHRGSEFVWGQFYFHH